MTSPQIIPDLVVARRVNAERILLLGWTRAILLQLAHPLVAAGVFDHSTARAGPLLAVRRLHDTVRSMLSLTFAEAAARHATLERIRAIHRRVRGALTAAAGPFPRGTLYRADDPALLLWVHGTLMESLPLVYRHVVGPLSSDDHDRYCAEAAGVAVALGADAAAVPTTAAALERYMAGMQSSGVLAVGESAREMARLVLAPPAGALVPPLRWANRIVAIGLLPPHVRGLYGFGWNEQDERRLRLTLRMLRVSRRLLPLRLAHWRDARAYAGTRYRTPATARQIT